MKKLNNRIIISGGGTGGHVFPAISIADAIKRQDSSVQILFVGALGKIEMEKVPAAGYEIVGLPIQGFRRKLSFNTVKTIAKLIFSLIKARKIINNFKPGLVIGVGGYASGPVLRIAGKKGIPTLIQEQNSYAGVTNKLLAKTAKKICVAYDNMDRYFPAEKIINTGNPIREVIKNFNKKKSEGLDHFGLKNNRQVALSLGGSLGAGTINKSLEKGLDKLKQANIQLIWQTGKYYFDDLNTRLSSQINEDIVLTQFITEMEKAFAAADVIISRAGAGTISELCVIGKPVILIPSPNVAEDHQTKNARALSDKNAAVFIADKDAEEVLADELIKLINDKEKQKILSQNIKKLAKPESDEVIANEALKLLKH